MHWQKLGMLWKPTGDVDWAQSHATQAVVQVISSDRWAIYLSSRDSLGKSRIGRLTVDPAPLATGGTPEVIAFDPQPVLSLGTVGAFDDSGVMPSCLVEHEGELRLYYMGWNVLKTVPYRVSIGLAISRNGGATFQRYSDGPIIDRSVAEPYFATTPNVHREGDRWRMWYASATGWRQIADRWEPRYLIKHVDSTDGIAWNLTGQVCIDPGEGFAAGSPCVYRLPSQRYGMFYSFRSLTDYRFDRSKSYRLGYAESADGDHWSRCDEHVGIDRSDEGWDWEMIAYSTLQRHDGALYLLYNGNGFGKSGVGIAKLANDH